jgi:hypothetical protein
MVYYSYLDDSKDQTQSKMYVSAGFIGTIDDWGKLRTSWGRCLKEYGLEYYKTSEYKMLGRQFAKFRTNEYPRPTGRAKAAEIRDALLAISRSIPGIQGIGIAIPIDDYKKVCSRPEAQEFFDADPYRRALEGVFNETVLVLKKLSGNNKVAFVHDEESHFNELRGCYREYVENNPRHASLMGGFQLLDDKKHPPLQMADIIANDCLGECLKWLDSGRETAETTIPYNVHHFGAWTEHYMLSILKRNLIARGRPIPADLQAPEYG